MGLKIYCFSLYCEGYGQTKSQAFVSIRETERVAREEAQATNLRQFPIEEGWHNHQMLMIAIPENRIAAIAGKNQAEEEETKES